MEKEGVKAFYARDRASWRKWLAENHDTEKSVWLVIYKKSSNTPSVYYDEAVDEALCYGWIDSKPNKRDDESYYQFFAKRNPKSNWSKVNKDKIDRLMKEGLMAAPGLAMVQLAKETGTWTALDAIENLELPLDLKVAFESYPSSQENFENFPRSVKRGILEWIITAKRPATREKRVTETAALAAKNIRANQYRK